MSEQPPEAAEINQRCHRACQKPATTPLPCPAGLSAAPPRTGSGRPNLLARAEENAPPPPMLAGLCPSARCGGSEERRKMRMARGEEGAHALPLPLLPLLIDQWAAKPRGRVWDLLRPLPHAPHVYRAKLLHAVTPWEPQPPPRPQQIRSRAEAW